MNIRILYKKLVVTIFFFQLLITAFAGNEDTTVIKNTGSLASAIQRATDAVNLKLRNFSDLDKYIASQQFFIDQDNAGFTNEFFEKINTADPTIEEERLKAKAALGEVEATNSFVDYLSPSDINKLPIGLKKKVGNTEVTIAVSSAVFTTKYAELTLFARVKIPQSSPGELFFGIKGLKLSYKGGIIGDAKLVLLGDLAIPINGNNAALVLKGGFNMNTGQGEDKTYITIDCNGFKELGITAEVQFPRSLIVPVDATGNVVSGNVKAGINNLRISNWNDIITTVTFDKSFQLNGLKGIVFNVTNAGFDLSDYRNNPDIVYPQGYQQKYLQAENLNTWRGVYVKNLSVSLPKAFKDKERENERVSFGVKDLLIDNNGISGLFYAENILSITKGNASGWKFSVDSIRLAIEANHLLRAGFGGKIGLPVNNDYDTANKRKFLAYSAVITASADYVCRVNTMDSIDFDLWKAKVILKPNSYIQLTGNPDGFKPEAMLHGAIGVFIKSTDSKPRSDTSKAVASFKGIEFTALHLKTEAPYVTAQYFGYKGELKFGAFPASISDIALSSSTSNNELALAFNLKVNLNDENEFTGSTRLKIVGNMEQNQGIQSWKYSKLEIEEIAIHADIKGSFVLDGRVKFMDDDPVFGDGFSGSVNAEFKKGINVKVAVNAIFGRTTYRYWYVDGKVDLGKGIGAPIKLQGFGGGAYYRMKKDGFDQAFSPTGTGVKYKPDSTAGLGVKAAVIFSVGDKKIANGEASFEMAFNKGGGLRYIGFFGFAKILTEIKIPSGVENLVKGRFKDLENKLSGLDSAAKEQLDKLKLTDASKAAKEQTVTTERPGEEGLSAYIGIQYDFNAKTLHANFDMYLNAAGGLLRGIGNDYRAGWAVLHIEPSTWYLHMGTPTNPIGIRMGIGPLSITTTSYFMAGHNLPAFPAPPQKVLDVLRQSGLNYVNDISSQDLAGGRGLAFGAGIQVNTGDLRFLVLYANFAAGLGFDVMLKDYGDAHCAGKSERIGINGWYAHGQAYAYLQGELGIRIKIGPIKKRIPIIKGGAAALLQAKLPNPTWVGGYMGFYVHILGGLVKGRFNFKFSFGNDCVIVNDDGAADENIQIIETLTPDDGATVVSVLASPKLKFRIKPDEEMEVRKEDGSGYEYFKARVESFKIYKAANEIPATLKYNEDGTELSLKPVDVLSSNTAYKIVALVAFQQKINGKWVGLSENGVKVQEKKEYTFTTGLAPDTLEHTLLQRMYPFFDQRNFYKDEPNKGVIKLNQRYSPYFAKFGKWKVKVETLDGMAIATNYATTKDDSLFTFALPSNLNASTTYRLLLLGEEPTDPSSDINKPGLKFTFTTSMYGSLSSKLQALRLTQPVVNRVSSDVIDLQAEVNNYEGFELYEIAGDKYTEYKPMIQGEINVDGEFYYNDIIKPLIYPPNPIVANGGPVYIQDPEALIYGAPPFKAVTTSWYYINSLQSQKFNNLLRTRMPFVHNANKYYNLHFLELRKKVINAYIGQSSLLIDAGQVESFPIGLRPLVNEAFPFMLKGEYKIRLSFVQLDGTRGIPGEFIYQNPLD